MIELSRPQPHASRRYFRHSMTGLLSATAIVMAGCGKQPAAEGKPPTSVRAQPAEKSLRGQAVTLTGEIRARVQSDLSFRFAGRLAERKVNVGDHVEAGQVLAVLETNEQEADVNSARAGLQAAEATLKQTTSAFERQQTLMKTGFTTQSSFDNAKQAVEGAQAALEGAKAALATVEDQLANTSLRADAAGIVTARNAEAGQVVEAAQPIFTVAQDGARDAVFEIYESLLIRQPADTKVEIVLLSDPSIKTVGTVREVAPAIDPSTGTVRAKVGIDRPPPQMALGAPVSGIGQFQPRSVVALPWTAFSVTDGKPAVWVIDPQSHIASPKPVVIDSYRTGELLLRDGLNPGDLVVTSGAQLLRPGEKVAPQISVAPSNTEKSK